MNGRQLEPQEDPYMEVCPDSHHCLNGSKCVENHFDEGSYYCDCQETIWEAAYEGLRCEHKAEVYCVAEGVSKKHFCANGGTCLAIVDPSEAHLGCDCPKGYTGSYCQFVEGTVPEGWPFNNPANENNYNGSRGGSGVNGGMIAGIVIGSVVTVVAIALIAIIRQKRTGESAGLVNTKDGMTGRDMNLEEDGAVMKEALEDTMMNSHNAVQLGIADEDLSMAKPETPFSQSDDLSLT